MENQRECREAPAAGERASGERKRTLPAGRTDGRVQCPFYRYDESIGRRIHRIICEGLVAGSSLILSYTQEQDYRIQLETFCCSCFRRCEICRMLMEKYED